MTDKTKVFVYTSSHGLEHRFFPEEFSALFHLTDPFSLQEIDAEGGRQLSWPCVLNDIKIKASENAPMKQVIVVILGDNDLRPGRHGRRAKRPEELRPLVSNILQHCHRIPGCWVVFASLIPSIGHSNTTKESFIAFNRIMKEETDKFRFSSFCQFTRRLCVNGVLQPTYYTDDVHLSPIGAEIIARALHRHLQYITKNF